MVVSLMETCSREKEQDVIIWDKKTVFVSVLDIPTSFLI